jgi:hypothetical protein
VGADILSQLDIPLSSLNGYIDTTHNTGSVYSPALILQARAYQSDDSGSLSLDEVDRDNAGTSAPVGMPNELI